MSASRADFSRIFVTGLGTVSPFGVGVKELWKGLREARSAVKRIDDRIDLEGINSKIGAPVPDFDPTDYLSKKKVRRLGRSAQFALIAGREALEDGGVDPQGNSLGVVVGTGIGDIESLTRNHRKMMKKGARRVSPFFIPQLMPNAAPAQMAIEFGCRGPNYGAVSACASGTHAVGLAFNELRLGKAQAMLAGGVEAAMLPMSFAGFDRMKALSCRNDEPKKASRPFDVDRDGFVMGEGAGILLLETEGSVERRRATPYAEVLGIGNSEDAYHVTSPLEDGSGAKEAMGKALEDARIEPEEVDYVNAHGTSTPLNDKMETAAIKSLFGDYAYELPVSSTKSQIGHLTGAAGGVEAVVTCLALARNFLPPTINLDNPDPACDLDYVPHQGREREIDMAISNSFGFGGQNASLVLKGV